MHSDGGWVSAQNRPCILLVCIHIVRFWVCHWVSEWKQFDVDHSSSDLKLWMWLKWHRIIEFDIGWGLIQLKRIVGRRHLCCCVHSSFVLIYTDCNSFDLYNLIINPSLFIQGGFTKSSALFFRNTFSYTCTIAPGSCSVQPQSDSLTTQQLHCSCWSFGPCSCAHQGWRRGSSKACLSLAPSKFNHLFIDRKHLFIWFLPSTS